MTSLEKQLERLAVPHTQTVYGEDKRRKSLLFEPSEAASLDKETFYSLGINGLEELETIDASFQEYESNLFAESSISLERSVQTKEVNDRLNETLSQFLIRLSPYCLLKPAHKALEWLIYRYHIHQYNLTELMMCVLPYHESKIFVRVVQLLPLDAKTASMWDWIQPLQKSGVHLAKMTLVNHCRTNPAFLSTICDTVYQSVKAHTQSSDSVPQLRTLFTFYTTTVIGVLDSGKVREELVSTLLAHISHGLRSKVLDYKAAAFMIVAQLLFKAKLEDSLLKTLMNGICKYVSAPLLQEAASCLLLMFQTQNVTSLSKRVFKYLCRKAAFVDCLASMSVKFKADALMEKFILKLIPSALRERTSLVSSGNSSDSDTGDRTPQYIGLLFTVMSTAKLSNSTAKQAVRHLVQNYVKCCQSMTCDDSMSDFNSSLLRIVRLLEGRYSTVLEECMEEILAEAGTIEKKALVQAFLTLSVESIKDESETGVPVILLYHPNSTIRWTSTRKFIQNIDTMEDEDFVSDTLLSRLQDDDLDVVQAVLEIPDKEKLWKYVKDQGKLFDVLVKMNAVAERERFRIIDQSDAEKDSKKEFDWMQVEALSLEVLCRCPVELTDSVLEAVMRYFFMLDDTEIELDMYFEVEMSLRQRKGFLQYFHNRNEEGADPEEMKHRTMGSFNLMWAQFLGEGMVHMDMDDTLALIESWSTRWKSSRMTCLMLILTDYLMENRPYKLDLCLRQMDMIQQVLKQTNNKTMYIEKIQSVLAKSVTSVCECLYHQRDIEEQFLLTMLYRTLPYLSQFRGDMPEGLFWSCHSDDQEKDKLTVLLINMFNFLLDSTSSENVNCHLYKKALLQLTNETFPDMMYLFRFLGLLWTQHCNPDRSALGLTTVSQARALQIGKAHLQYLTLEQETEITPQMSTVLVNLMVLMTSPHQSLRDTALTCLDVIQNTMEKTKHIMYPLVVKLIRCRPEISANSEYVIQVVKSVFKGCYQGTETDSHRKKKKHVMHTRKVQALDELVAMTVAMETPAYIQRAALELLQGLESQKLLYDLFPLLTKLLSAMASGCKNDTNFDCVRLILQRFTPDMAELLPSGDEGLQLLMKALHTLGGPEDASTSVQLCSLGQIDKVLYKVLPAPSKRDLFGCLINVLVETQSHVVSSAVRKVIKQLPLESADIVDDLQSSWKVASSPKSTVKESKRRKRLQEEEDKESEEFERPGWHRTILILEGLQHKKKLVNSQLLLPICFQILSRVLDSDEHSSAEYIKQLILSLINHICQKIQDEEKEPEDKFNMELIVQTIRTSSNPQTHNQALLLLTTTARLYPEHLLHNVMSVFTFMGANILRQDDAYSIQIIGRILETVIPALITACKRRTNVPKDMSSKVEDVITMVIRVFVDAFPHIPDHRRLMLFTKLVQIVGEDQYLWRTLLLLVAHLVTRNIQSNNDTMFTEKEILSKDMEFCLQLASQFSVTTQLVCATDAVMYIGQLPEEKAEDVMVQRSVRPQSLGKLRKEDTEIYNVKAHSAKQLRHFKYKVVELLVSLHTSQVFIVQVSSCKDLSLLHKFKSLLQRIMEFLSKVTKTTDSYQDTPTARYWRVFQHKVYDLLEKVVTLLPDDMFIEVVSSLMDHALPNVQRKALELLNTNLHQKRDALTQHESMLLLPLVDKILAIVQRTGLVQEGMEEIAVNAQTALYTLKILCRHLGEKNPHTFIKVLKMAVLVFTKRTDNLQLSACGLLCIAEICHCLKVHVIVHLSSFMPKLIKCLEKHDTLLTNELFLLSVVTTLQKVVESLFRFLSPYANDIIVQVCRLSAVDTDLDVMKKPQTQQRLKNIRTSLATLLPFRVMLPSVTSCYEQFSNDKLVCVEPLMSLLEHHITNMGREDLTSNLAQLRTFFLVCLDFRTQHPEVEESEVAVIEGSVIQTIISMVMKLSESTFRPFLLELYTWGTRDTGLKSRAMVFYRLADSLAEKLKSLFTLFAGHFVQHAAQMLDLNNSSKTDKQYFGKGKPSRRLSHQLLVYIIDCLYKCFLYDTDGFLNKDRLDCLMQPLVDQLDNTARSEKLYRKRVHQHLVPCLVQLTVATQDDSLWKSINYQILLKTRHETPQVRLGALRAVDEIHKRLGEDYLGLLPETIPFLAELMEDECEEVEKECQAVIGEMEKTLGEPLQKYF